MPDRYLCCYGEQSPPSLIKVIILKIGGGLEKVGEEEFAFFSEKVIIRSTDN